MKKFFTIIALGILMLASGDSYSAEREKAPPCVIIPISKIKGYPGTITVDAACLQVLKWGVSSVQSIIDSRSNHMTDVRPAQEDGLERLGLRRDFYWNGDGYIGPVEDTVMQGQTVLRRRGSLTQLVPSSAPRKEALSAFTKHLSKEDIFNALSATSPNAFIVIAPGVRGEIRGIAQLDEAIGGIAPGDRGEIRGIAQLDEAIGGIAPGDRGEIRGIAQPDKAGGSTYQNHPYATGLVVAGILTLGEFARQKYKGYETSLNPANEHFVLRNISRWMTNGESEADKEKDEIVSAEE